MSIATLLTANRLLSPAWRVLIVGAVYGAVMLALDRRLAGAGLGLLKGAGYAVVFLPLARRLPYRFGTRTIALFAPLYWISTLSNLVEAYFITSIKHSTLIAGAVLFGLTALGAAALIARLFPATARAGDLPGLRTLLAERPLISWAWRIALFAAVFAVFVQALGVAWGPLISRYYHDPAYIAQAHIAHPGPPDWVVWTEEYFRGVVFALVLLPVLAVFRGRSWPSIAWLAIYVVVVDAALEAWLSLIGSGFPIGFTVGEGLDLTTDAMVRGVFVALLLALPATVALQAVRATRSRNRSLMAGHSDARIE